jgi:2-phosphosulfolactate phosphatase
MKVDTFFTTNFVEKEEQFANSIVIMIDVLRASSTIANALLHNAKEIIPVESTEKAVELYSKLSRETRLLAGERNGVKPAGFELGNSPLEFNTDTIKGKTIILTTTNGTKLYQKAKKARIKIIGSFVNSDSVINYIDKLLLQDVSNEVSIQFLCAGSHGQFSYEDTLCAGFFIYKLIQLRSDLELSDASHAAKSLYLQFSENLKDFLKTKEHPSFLKSIGLGDDIDFCLELNKCPVVPVIHTYNAQMGLFAIRL